MNLKEKSENLNLSITQFYNIDKVDKKELEHILQFGQKAIETIEELVDAVLNPLIKAKKELFESQKPENVRKILIKLSTDFYDDLNEAQDIVNRFSKLKDNFHHEIRPVLSKYCTEDEIYEWQNIFQRTVVTRSMSHEKIENFIPEIEDFVMARFHSEQDDDKLTFKEVVDYLNGVIGEMRKTKKKLQAVKANFLQLSGLRGLSEIKKNKLSPEFKKEELQLKLSSIKDLVGSSRIEKALDELEDLCMSNYPEILKDVFLLQGQYAKTNRDFYTGMDNDKITPNRINFGILELINEISKRENLT